MTLDKFSESEASLRLSNYTTFFFTRNPVTRLFSAYRNKFTDKENAYYPADYGTRIIKKYRLNATEDELKTGKNVKFEEFAMFVADADTHMSVDEHWRQMADICEPCQVNYDYVGRYETLSEDTENLLKELNLDHLIQIPSKSSVLHYYGKNLKPTPTSLGEMFKNVSFSYLHKLWEYYKMDFLLFRYEYPYLTHEWT